MLAKYWKQACFVVMVIAILFNITIKLISKSSLKRAIEQSAQYIYVKQEQESKSVEEK